MIKPGTRQVNLVRVQQTHVTHGLYLENSHHLWTSQQDKQMCGNDENRRLRKC